MTSRRLRPIVEFISSTIVRELCGSCAGSGVPSPQRPPFWFLRSPLTRASNVSAKFFSDVRLEG